MRPFRSMPALALLLALPALGADTYRIDATHSEVSFRIRHLVSKTAGTFKKFEGKVVLDDKDWSKSSVSVTIDASSVDTANTDRDAHLRNPDFFDVAKFPTITFTSTSVREASKGKLEVTGDFTLHGVTKRITLPISVLGVVPGMKPGMVVAGFEGTVTLDRNDYGVSKFKGMLGDDVAVTLAIEAVKVP